MIDFINPFIEKLLEENKKYSKEIEVLTKNKISTSENYDNAIQAVHDLISTNNAVIEKLLKGTQDCKQH